MMELTDRKAHVLAYLAQELPLKWQDRDCVAHPSARIREAAMSCGTALAYLELTASLEGLDPHIILQLADSGYELAHGQNGFEKPARVHGMDEVGYKHTPVEEWVRVLSRNKKEAPARVTSTDERKE